MKELSVEEKAKRYDEAIKKAKSKIKNDKDHVLYEDDVIEMFPELAESEDEKIRKSLIDMLKNDEKCYLKEIAWLEKQGEQKPYGQRQECVDCQFNYAGECKGSCAMKRGEQKPVDRVEPKFRKGDWVVYCNDDVDLITGIEENGYCINNGGYIPFVCENEMRLWDITDAKVGDVLVSESTCGLGTWYCIFKSLDGDESMTVYCYLARDGRFETKKELCFDKDPYNTKPATKEQRDLLFQKMKEAGYEWDAEKKELRKIEQKSAWSEKYIADVFEKVGLAKIVREQENDSLTRALQSAMIELAKYSVVPQIRQEWSEEDERQARQIERIVHDDGCTQKLQKQIADWFKSLKERCNWKPSDEQMNALNYVVNLMASSERPTENDLYYNILKSLRQQLMKLKG